MATIFGQFELIGNLGSGSMAELYRAKSVHKPEMGVVVIKRVRPEFRYDTNLMARFIEGAQSVVGLYHENIAMVIEAGVMVGRYYVATEYIHGKDLRHIQAQFQTTRRALPIPLAMHVMSEVCKGLNYAHTATAPATGEQLDVIHGDVSTQNIMISYDGAVKLINLEGAAFRAKGWASIHGKCAYMSPEQAAGQDIDVRSDLFSAGIVFWEIATGKRLFEGQDDEEVRSKVEKAEIVAPTEANRMVPKDLEAIIMRALQRDRDRRYQSAAEMQKDLEAFGQKSRLTFSAKQLGGWMKMTFADDIAGQDLASMVSSPLAGLELPAPPPPPAKEPELEEPDWQDEEDEGEDEDATRIDPTSQLLAELEKEDEEEAAAVAAPPAPPVVAAPDPPDDPRRQRPSGDVEQVDAVAESARLEVARLDRVMKENRRLQKNVSTRERPVVKAEVEVVGDQPGGKGARVAPPPTGPAGPGRISGVVDEREAGDLDAALRDRRTLESRLSGEGRVRLRFERQGSSGNLPEVEERRTLTYILLIVGVVLVLGLGLLAWLLLSADEEEVEEPATVGQVLRVDAPRQSPRTGSAWAGSRRVI